MQQFGRDEEVLALLGGLEASVDAEVFGWDVVRGGGGGGGGGGRGGRGTGDTDHTGVYESLVARIHALVYFVDDAEGRAGEGLEGHEVENCRDGAFAAGLAVRGELGEGFGFSGEELEVSRKGRVDSIYWV